MKKQEVFDKPKVTCNNNLTIGIFTSEFSANLQGITIPIKSTTTLIRYQF